MQWYRTEDGVERLRFEKALMNRFFPQFSLFADDYDNLFWSGPIHLPDLGREHGDVHLLYGYGHPYSMMEVYVYRPSLNPSVSHHIREDGKKICYLKDSHWRLTYTAVTITGMAIRFLREYWTGRLEP